MMSFFSRMEQKSCQTGDIEIQAQDGRLSTWSTQDSIISSGKNGAISSRGTLLSCGGGYIRIKDGNVEIGGPGKLLIKNNGIQKLGPQSVESYEIFFTRRI